MEMETLLLYEMPGYRIISALLVVILTVGMGCGESTSPDDSLTPDAATHRFETPWRPAPGTSWQWQLLGDVDTSIDVAMYDIDLFDPPDSTFEDLRAAGRIIICYFSAGSWEEWRDDAEDFPPESLGNILDGWPDERWVDFRLTPVRDVMKKRLDLAVTRGCDGVEPDNVDGYANDNGLGLTAAEQLDFNLFLAEAAHARGLSIGLKNDLDQLESLVEHFDWALNESCAEYNECDRLSVFTDAGKAVFHVEYVDDWSEAAALAQQVCGASPNLDTLIKTWDLKDEWLACP